MNDLPQPMPPGESTSFLDEAPLRAFYERSPMCMGITEVLEHEPDVLHIFDNAATCRFFGVAAGSTEGRRACAELGADPRVIGAWIRAYGESEANGTPVRFEHDYQTPQGTRWLAATVWPLGRGPSGRTRFCYIALDITGRKQADAELRENAERLRLALDAGGMGTWEWNLQAGKITWSRELEAMHGYEPGTFPGTVEAYNAEVHPEDREHVGKAIAASLQGGGHHLEYRIVRRDNSVLWVEGRGRLFRNERGEPWRLVGVCSDITRRKQAELALREEERRKDEFIATLAHELRNPLAPISNALQILNAKKPSDGQAAWSLEVIDRQLRHMSRLLDDLLDVSRISRGKAELRKTRVALSAVIESAVETSRPAIEEGQQALEVDVPEGVFLDADPIRLAQVFSNLLNNAAKFTPPRRGIRVRAQARHGTLEVAVSDDGIGLAPETIPTLFQMFCQVEPARERARGGLGIGLALAKALVEMHGGTIEARSEGVGRGAQFVVRLPCAGDGELPQPSGVTPAGARPHASGRRVLIIDDLRDGADTLATLLGLMGHEVKAVYDAESGLRMAEQFKPDVLLIDLGLPGISGYEACRRVRQTPWGREAVIVALTGWGQDEDRRQSRAAGFDHHMVKPPDVEQLAALLG